MQNLKMPAMFIGHGSPMNALAKNDYSKFLNQTGRRIPKPKAILAVSAHWETHGTQVLNAIQPKTIHDFGGFPDELFKIQYPAKGAPEVSSRVAELLKTDNAQLTAEWGLDHGTWSVLVHLYPAAEIPVLQLSLNRKLKLREHYELAQKLIPLRNEGVLILGSGNITHNLRALNWDSNSKAFAWALQFDEMIKKAIIEKDLPCLFNEISADQSLWNQALPTLEHYLPLLYILGAAEASESPKFIYEEMQMASLSMRSVEMSNGPRGPI